MIKFNELIKMIPLLEFLSKVDDVRIVIQKVVNGNYINYTEVNESSFNFVISSFSTSPTF